MTSIPRFEVSGKYTPSRTLQPKTENTLTAGVLGDRDSAIRLSDRSISSRDEDKLGFANLPDQMHRKAVKKGFNFTLMVVGESGLGKSTLINSLFMQELYKDRVMLEATAKTVRTTQIEKRNIELDERGVKLKLTIVDTPGFGDALNAEQCWRPIEDYIDNTFEQYFKDECGLNRKNIQDNRVHCCLYFVSSAGHGLKPIDVEFMRRLQGKVNLVPVIAKSDTLTVQELRQFKERLRDDLEQYKIEIYRLPECDSDEEDEVKRLDKEIKAVLPFAVIGSNCLIDTESGKKVRGREYPWGVVEVENGKHCDFAKLRVFLLKTHMQDLKDMTLEVHYEAYRAKYITERMSKRQADRKTTPSLLGDTTSAKHNAALEPPSTDSITEADALLKQKEEEVQRLQRIVSQMQLHEQHPSLNRNNQVVNGNSQASLLSGSRSSLASSQPPTAQFVATN